MQFASDSWLISNEQKQSQEPILLCSWQHSLNGLVVNNCFPVDTQTSRQVRGRMKINRIHVDCGFCHLINANVIVVS